MTEKRERALAELHRKWSQTPPIGPEAIDAAYDAGAAEACSREERAVLDACAKAEVELDEEDPEQGAQELGENCYIYTHDQHEIANAELARRKAKP